MPRIPVHTVANAPEHSRDELKGPCRPSSGKMLNIHGEMAHTTVVLPRSPRTSR